MVLERAASSEVNFKSEDFTVSERVVRVEESCWIALIIDDKIEMSMVDGKSS